MHPNIDGLQNTESTLCVEEINFKTISTDKRSVTVYSINGTNYPMLNTQLMMALGRKDSSVFKIVLSMQLELMGSSW